MSRSGASSTTVTIGSGCAVVQEVLFLLHTEAALCRHVVINLLVIQRLLCAGASSISSVHTLEPTRIWSRRHHMEH